MRLDIDEIRPKFLSPTQFSEEALFLGTRGTRLALVSIGRVVRDYARQAGLYHITTHKLRHTFSLHMLRNGYSIRYIQELLGHEKIDTNQVYTQIYGYVLSETVRLFHPGNVVK